MNFQIRELKEFTEAEKCEKFDQLYKNAARIYKDAEQNGYHNEDEPQYCFEANMEILTPKGESNKVFWNHFNKLTN